MPADVLDTPVPVIDLTIAERNIDRLQTACDAAGVANWPHIKTHKSVRLARLQIERGARGISCQKLGEAKLMADAGLTDILISYPVVGAAKEPRLAALAARANLTVCCDSIEGADGLARAMQGSRTRLRVLVECDTGRRRSGVVAPEVAVAVARRVAESGGLHFAGLLTYPPNGAVDGTVAFIAAVRGGCAAHDLTVETVSAGGTPNVGRIGEAGETEYRAGTSIYNDRQMVSLGAASIEDCALFVHATVVSRPEPTRAIVDAGSKSLTSDLMGFTDFGLLVDYPGARIHQLAEEHGFVDLTDCERRPHIGEIVRILPNHVCPVVNLFDRVLITRGGKPEGWLAIDARGRVA